MGPAEGHATHRPQGVVTDKQVSTGAALGRGWDTVSAQFVSGTMTVMKLLFGNCAFRGVGASGGAMGWGERKQGQPSSFHAQRQPGQPKHRLLFYTVWPCLWGWGGAQGQPRTTFPNNLCSQAWPCDQHPPMAHEHASLQVCGSLRSLASLEARTHPALSCYFSQPKARTPRPDRMMGASRIASKCLGLCALNC